MNILICGGRNFSEAAVVSYLEKHLHDITEIPPEKWKDDITIIEGGARGADLGGYTFAQKHGCQKIRFDANWKQHGKAAGFIRNQKMINEGKPDIVIAFPGKQGTADMIRRSLKAHIRTVKITFGVDEGVDRW